MHFLYIPLECKKVLRLIFPQFQRLRKDPSGLQTLIQSTLYCSSMWVHHGIEASCDSSESGVVAQPIGFAHECQILGRSGLDFA